MSAEAQGWVYRHSPYRGATFTVHLALADSANDQHDYELWMSMATIGAKARVDSGSARRAMAALTADGFVEMLEAGNGTTNRYRFLFPDGAPVVFETRRRGTKPVDKSGDEADEPRAPCATPRAGRATPARTERGDPARDARLSQEDPKVNPRQEQADPKRAAFEKRVARDTAAREAADNTDRADPTQHIARARAWTRGEGMPPESP